MGCLIEFIIEAFGEFILAGYCHLMALVIPKSGISVWNRARLERFVEIFSFALLMLTAVGLILVIPPFPPIVTAIGKYTLFVCLGLLCVYILFGIILHIFAAVRKKK